MIWLVCALVILCFALLAKILCMRFSLREITSGLHRALESNTLIDISSRDREVCSLANALNRELRVLHAQRSRYLSGDRELKVAAANLSHDLRTPLTAISGYLELLAREEHTERARRYLSVIEERTEAMKRLTEELFRFTVLLSAPVPEKEDVNLCAALEESLAAHYAQLNRRGIVPQIHLPSVPVTRRLSRESLSRIFDNLLSNAVRCSDGDLSVSLSEDGVIRFANRASALDNVQAARLFDRFYTVRSARGSTGLGLSIARHLTEQLGGQISAAYEQGTLMITLTF